MPAPGPQAAGIDEDDRIEIRGLRVLGTHGVLAEEKERAQPFEVDLDLWVDLAAASTTDRLSDTVDYAGVAGAVSAVVAGPAPHELLESLAGAIAGAVLARYPRIAAVTVGVRKLRPPVPVDLDTVGVRITRRR